MSFRIQSRSYQTSVLYWAHSSKRSKVKSRDWCKTIVNTLFYILTGYNSFASNPGNDVLFLFDICDVAIHLN